MGLEFGAFLAFRPLLQFVPRGDGHRVLVLPGLLTGDESTIALRQYLRSLGYYVGGWKLGQNIGPTGQIMGGRVHAHLTFSDEEKAMGGHLEPGSHVLTFAIITLAELPDNDLSRWDRVGRYAEVHAS